MVEALEIEHYGSVESRLGKAIEIIETHPACPQMSMMIHMAIEDVLNAEDRGDIDNTIRKDYVSRLNAVARRLA